MNFKDKLIQDICALKTEYHADVILELLEQINKVPEITSTKYYEAKGNLQRAAKTLTKKKIYIDSLYKKARRLEIHNFAPELNKLHLTDGTTINAPQQTTIQDALNYIYKHQ